MSYAALYKRKHHHSGFTPLSVLMFRDGSLDADLETGTITHRGIVLSQGENSKGYRYVQLGRCFAGKRRRENAWVHRLVKMKAIAVGLGGDNWRKYVQVIGHRLDVNHANQVRSDNRASNLEIMTEVANRQRREMNDAEWKELEAAW